MLLPKVSMSEEKDVSSVVTLMFEHGKKHTKDKPSAVYILPFRPNSHFDVESRVANLLWDFIIDEISDLSFFFGERIKVKIYNDQDYVDQLRDPSGKGTSKAGEKIIEILNSTTLKHGVNSIFYGLYDGDDSELHLVMHLYSNVDNVIFREKLKFSENFMDVKLLRDALKNNLTISQELIKEKIRKKTENAIIFLLKRTG